MKNTKRVIINIASGGAGYILPMLINVISTPYVLSELGEKAFGVQILANVIVGYLIVADMGMDIPVTHKVAECDARKNFEELGKFIAATLKIYLFIGLLGMLTLLLLSNTLVSWLSIPEELRREGITIFWLSGVGFAGSIINMWGRAIFNGLHRYEITNGLSVSTNLLGVLLGVFLIWKGYGVVGFFASRVFGFLIMSIIYIYLSSKYLLRFSFVPFIDREIWISLRSKIGYGFLMRMSGMIFSRMDQVLIGSWVGISFVTVYSFPVLIVTTISGLLASLTHFAFPMVTALTVAAFEQVELFFVRVTKFIVVLATLLYFPFIVFGDKIIGLWISEKIACESEMVLRFLLIAFYINSILTIGLNSFVMGKGEIRYFTFYSVGRGFVLFGGFLILIPIYGINGAGAAYLMAIGVDTFFTLKTLWGKLNFNVVNVLKTCYLRAVLIGLILLGGMWMIKDLVTTWIDLGLSFSIYGVSYLLLSYVFGVLDLEEKALFRQYLNRIFHR